MSRRRKAIYFNLFSLSWSQWPTLAEMYDAVGTKTRIDCMSSHFGRDFCRRGGGDCPATDTPREFCSEDLCLGFGLGVNACT